MRESTEGVSVGVLGVLGVGPTTRYAGCVFHVKHMFMGLVSVSVAASRLGCCSIL